MKECDNSLDESTNWILLNDLIVGETFILFNKQMKGNKRELIQLGVPIFGQIREDAKSKYTTIQRSSQIIVDFLYHF